MEFINLLEFTGWCNDSHIQDVFSVIRNVLEIIRIVVPIGLIVMTVMDVMKKVLNPNEKEGQKKIMTRAIAAVIVFLIPTIITITLKIVDAGKGSNSDVEGDSKVNLSACWGGDY